MTLTVVETITGTTMPCSGRKGRKYPVSGAIAKCSGCTHAFSSYIVRTVSFRVAELIHTTCTCPIICASACGDTRRIRRRIITPIVPPNTSFSTAYVLGCDILATAIVAAASTIVSVPDTAIVDTPCAAAVIAAFYGYGRRIITPIIPPNTASAKAIASGGETPAAAIVASVTAAILSASYPHTQTITLILNSGARVESVAATTFVRAVDCSKFFVRKDSFWRHCNCRGIMEDGRDDHDDEDEGTRS